MAKANNSDDSKQILRSTGGFLVCPQLRTENGELRTVWKRHTGVLEGTPSSKAALWDAHGNKDAGNPLMIPYFNYAVVEKRHGRKTAEGESTLECGGGSRHPMPRSAEDL